MEISSAVMVVVPDAGDQEFATQIANSLGYSEADTVIGTSADGARAIAERTGGSPRYIVVDIADRGTGALADLDTMAEYCEADTQVIILGAVNDVQLYRELKQRGVTEYFTRPVEVSAIRAAFLNASTSSSGKGGKGTGTVISFMGAASGDGSSTIAVNTAFALASAYKQPTILIDMDFQFGMHAKNLDLNTQFGLKELFEHPERGIDATLVDKMTAKYARELSIIATPNDLRFLPSVKPEVIRDLIATLKEKYTYIIIDLPHIWTPWIAAALSSSSHVVLTAQLWLRSLNHAARLLAAWKNIGVSGDTVTVTVNRSGAKFKEALTSGDFERITHKKIDAYFSNDIKTIVEAENQGKTLLEVSESPLGAEIRAFAAGFLSEDVRMQYGEVNKPQKRSLLSKLKEL